MTGKTHVICGTITMLAITMVGLQGFQIGGIDYQPALGLLSVRAGSYAPDIDIQQSTLGQKYKFISRRLTHRGITHTLVIPLLLIVAMLWVASTGIPILPELILGFNVGWVAHIIADLCNKTGVPIFWPVKSERVHIASFLTGSWQEKLFIILWLGVNLIWVLFQLT